MKRFLAGAALSLLLAAPAAADVSPEAALAGVEAGSALGDYMAELEKSENRLPKLSDPRGAELLRKLFDAGAVVAGRPQSTRGVPELSVWNDVARAALLRYLSRTASDDRAEAERGIAEYQDELTLAFTFLTRATANLSQSVEARAATLPNTEAADKVRQEGREIMRAGLMGIVQGALMTIGAPAFKPENARALTGALADDMPLFAPMLTPESGLAIRQMAEASGTAQQDPDTVANLRRIVWSPLPEKPAASTAPAVVVAADRQSWQTAVRDAIARRKDYPQDLKDARDKGQPLPSGKVMVSMTIDRSGALTNSTVASGSGVRRLDETALQAVRDAAPFPAVPADVEGDMINLQIPINFMGGDPAVAGPASPASPTPAAVKPKAEPRPKKAAPPKPAAATAPGTAVVTPKPPATQRPAAPPKPAPAPQP